MHDTITYWVGYPADDRIGCIDCGTLRSHPRVGKPARSGDANTISELEDTFGAFVTMVPSPLGKHCPGVVGFVTDQGYRVALVPSLSIDMDFVQEAVAEWVEGAS